MATSHLAYNLMKMPGGRGILTVAGDTKEALAALKLTFGAVVAARSASEATPGAKEAAPAKKK